MAVLPLREWGASSRYIILQCPRGRAQDMHWSAESQSPPASTSLQNPSSLSPAAKGLPAPTPPPPPAYPERSQAVAGRETKGKLLLSPFWRQNNQIIAHHLEPTVLLLMRKGRRLLSLRPLAEGHSAKHHCLSELETSASIVQLG